jgi:hypothetical protein
MTMAAAPSDAGGIKYHIANDRLIKHGTNIPGFIDAMPDIVAKAITNPNLQHWLNLYRSSLRDASPDQQMLFQLILLDEISGDREGPFAQRLRTKCTELGILGDLESISTSAGIALPVGKDVVDVIVKLRNSAAHNGRITADTLREYGGDWLVPLTADLPQLHKLICEALRYLFCVLAGHTRESKMMLIEEKDGKAFEIRFD